MHGAVPYPLLNLGISIMVDAINYIDYYYHHDLFRDCIKIFFYLQSTMFHSIQKRKARNLVIF